MTLRRLFVGVGVLAVLCVWAWSRPGGKTVNAGQPDHAVAQEVDGDECNRGDQAFRFRTNQPRHWRHVMTGTH